MHLFDQQFSEQKNPVVFLLRSLRAFWFMLAGLSLALSACTTIPYNDFQDVQTGMNKSEVLHAAGNPTYTRHQDGKDRWIYLFDEAPEGSHEKEIQFVHNRVVYVGEKIKPELSAAEQDLKNEELNRIENERLLEERRNWKAQIGAAQATRTDENQDSFDRRLRESYYGIEPHNPNASQPDRFETIY